MTTERTFELFTDEAFRARVWCICEELTQDKEYQADMWAAAWAWISSSEDDDVDLESLIYHLKNWQRHLRNRWRKEPYGPLHFRPQPTPCDVRAPAPRRGRDPYLE